MVGWVRCLLFVKLRAKGRKVVLIILNASTFCVLVFLLIELEENSITVCLHVFLSDMQAKHCPRSLVAQVFSVGSVYKHRLANTNPRESKRNTKSWQSTQYKRICLHYGIFVFVWRVKLFCTCEARFYFQLAIWSNRKCTPLKKHSDRIFIVGGQKVLTGVGSLLTKNMHTFKTCALWTCPLSRRGLRTPRPRARKKSWEITNCKSQGV